MNSHGMEYDEVCLQRLNRNRPDRAVSGSSDRGICQDKARGDLEAGDVGWDEGEG